MKKINYLKKNQKLKNLPINLAKQHVPPNGANLQEKRGQKRI